MYVDEYVFEFNPRPGSLDRALDAGRRAVRLDADSGGARRVLAQVHFHRHELDSFFAEAERAIALNPNQSETLAIIGNSMIHVGELERGMALVKKAIALNPSYPDWYYFPILRYHYRKGEYEKALEAGLKINMPDFYWPHKLLAAVYGQLGRKAEARAAVERLLELYPGFLENPRDSFRRYSENEEGIEHWIDGLRKAGLDISDEPPPATD